MTTVIRFLQEPSGIPNWWVFGVTLLLIGETAAWIIGWF